ncbi:MAG: M48 family metalloprotease [Firmicutes bacterium]|nr:M48 family metalloprotease [Bacillota bacterium]
MPYCPACGQELAEGASYCQKCGAALKGRTGAMEATEAPAPGLSIDPKAFRHPKERLFFTLGAVVSGLAWIFLIWVAWPALLVLAFVFWLVGLYVKAFLYGNAVCLSEEQFRQVYAMARRMGEELRLAELPEVFVLSGQGALNALAMRFFSGRYILLYGELVDLMLRRRAFAELRMIIGHELAHHAIGHVSIWKRLLLAPAFFLPFFGAAYSRACELSADRVGMMLARDHAAALRALLALALGSEALAAEVKPEVFVAQEKHVPKAIGFLMELFATHPRMTKRMIEIEGFEREQTLGLSGVGAQAGM